MSLTFDAASAYDEAFAGKATRVVDHSGRIRPFDVRRWASDPDWVDCALFIEPCDGPTIDVGCGPGRLAAELTARQVPCLGIDVSSEAIRQARHRGAFGLQQDVFEAIPGEGLWDYALLADGNLGIGGDPVCLLTRLSAALSPEGLVIAELADGTVGLIRERRQLRVDGRLSVPFDWAVIGRDAIDEIAAKAGMRAIATRTVGGRHTVTLAQT